MGSFWSEDFIHLINFFWCVFKTTEDPLLKPEDIAEQLKILNKDSEDFLTYGFYGLYSLFILL